MEESHDAKASERFHTPPAYQSYSVEDYLRKMGVDVMKGVDAGGADKQDRAYSFQLRSLPQFR